ncbi:MAG: right-handed parallel beta-helix repeat-containing protein [Chloroflexota bacterium]
MTRSSFRPAFVAVSAVIALLFLAEPSTASADTYTVDMFADTSPSVQCTAAPNDCSLRGAIRKANTAPGGPHTVYVPNGTYTLSSVSGELIVLKSMTIRGAGGTVIIQAALFPGVATNRVLRVDSGTLTLANVEIRHGAASFAGGGINVQPGATLVGLRILVKANRAVLPGHDGQGGGISNYGTVTLSRSAIIDNTADYGGGLLVWPGGNATLTNTTVSGNRGLQYGGSGVFARHNSTVTLDSVTVYQNQVSSPTALTHAGGVYSYSEQNASPVANVTIKNSVIAANTYSGGIWNCAGTTITSQGNNLSDSTECPFTTGVNGDEEGVPVSLGALQNFSPQVVGHLPSVGSKAIDTATYAGAACQALDQRNSARPQDGNGDGQAICDKGAIERKSTD